MKDDLQKLTERLLSAARKAGAEAADAVALNDAAVSIDEYLRTGAW